MRGKVVEKLEEELGVLSSKFIEKPVFPELGVVLTAKLCDGILSL